MKKILSLVVTLLFTTSLSSFAQGNLQFNQVISASFNLGSNANSTTLTVPVGKVWKIESMGCNTSTPGYVKYVLNGVSYSLLTNLSKDAGHTIWLKSGDTFYMQTTVAGTIGVYYSILEFNIVP